MKKISLAQVKADQKCRIAEIQGGSNLHNKLMHMGVFKGKDVTKLSHIGLRGPVVIRAGRSILALGHGIAVKVMVEVE
ncbi:MAG: FeoA domain-containing protein [Candidatus Omnitrophota bacterium]